MIFNLNNLPLFSSPHNSLLLFEKALNKSESIINENTGKHILFELNIAPIPSFNNVLFFDLFIKGNNGNILKSFKFMVFNFKTPDISIFFYDEDEFFEKSIYDIKYILMDNKKLFFFIRNLFILFKLDPSLSSGAYEK